MVRFLGAPGQTLMGAPVSQFAPADIDEFTPGPWIAKSDHSVKSLAPGHWAVSGSCTGRRRQANARLIAAAPDLLHALMMCVIERKEWLDEARAAIAKATGTPT